MSRQFDAITLITTHPDGTVMGQCEQCGNGATDENRIDFPTLYQAEIVGTVRDAWGNESGICRECYERSKERTFIIYLHGGDDVMVECDTLERAMVDIADYLSDPDEYGRYAPFLVMAQRDHEDVERIALIDLSTVDKERSRKLHERGG